MTLKKENVLIDGYAAFAHVRKAIKEKYGNQRILADKLGISPSHLSDMLNSRCELSPAVLAACGLRRVLSYEVIR